MAKVDFERVRILIEDGYRNTDIAKMLGCSPSAISHIRRGAIKGPKDLVASFKNRLESKIKINDTGCWLLHTSILDNGYGYISFKGKATLAHRASYMAYKGEIPDGLKVCHSCDVRNCVNPDHLFLGTNSDNMKDMLVKGRGSIGESHYSAVLTEALVRELRANYKPGDSWMALEKKYGINRGVIRPAVLGRTWKHVK